jgi:carbamoyl-phosphate synthase large subunit
LSKRVAILGCGFGIGGVIRSLKEEGYTVIGLDSDPLAPGLYQCDISRYVPPTYSNVFLTQLVDVCVREHVDVLFPVTDDSVFLLSKNADILNKNSIGHLLPSDKAVELVINKYKFYTTLESANVPVAKFKIPESKDDVQKFIEIFGLPICFKKSFGSRGQGFAKVNILKNAMKEYEHDPRRIICEFLPGTEYEVEAVYDKTGHLMTMTPRKKVEYKLELGLTLKSVTIHSKELCKLVEETVKAIGGWVGPCSVELKESFDGKPKIIEMNPRFVTPTYLLTAAGVNIPSISTKLALEQTINNLKTHNSAKKGMYLTRMLKDVTFTETRF